MKKYIITLFITSLFVLPNINLTAQIGINIEDSPNLFHIDPSKNSNLAAGTGLDDDVVVDYDGNLGIGTIFPSQKVHLKGSLRIADGFQKEDRIFKDINGSGLGRWSDINDIQVINGELTQNSALGKSSATRTNLTSTNLVLPAGKWIIFASFTAQRTTSVGYSIWLYVQNTSDSSIISSVCQLPENTTSSGVYQATPQISTYVELSTTTTFAIYGAHAVGSLAATITYGPSYFYAFSLR